MTTSIVDNYIPEGFKTLPELIIVNSLNHSIIHFASVQSTKWV